MNDQHVHVNPAPDYVWPTWCNVASRKLTAKLHHRAECEGWTRDRLMKTAEGLAEWMGEGLLRLYLSWIAERVANEPWPERDEIMEYIEKQLWGLWPDDEVEPN